MLQRLFFRQQNVIHPRVKIWGGNNPVLVIGENNFRMQVAHFTIENEVEMNFTTGCRADLPGIAVQPKLFTIAGTAQKFDRESGRRIRLGFSLNWWNKARLIPRRSPIFRFSLRGEEAFQATA